MSSRTSAARLRCVICGTDQGVERNHVGGRNHVAWLTMPFCRKHHDQFHALRHVFSHDSFPLCRPYNSATIPQPDPPETVALTESAQNYFVSIFQKPSLLTRWK